MERNMRKTVLAYGLSKLELAKLELMGNKIILIDENNGGTRIRDLLADRAEPATMELPPEKVIIFNGYPEEELKRSVVAIRSNFTDKPIIAAVTDNSYNWPFEYLLTEHLIKDRDWNRKNAKEYHANLMKENEAARKDDKASDKGDN